MNAFSLVMPLAMLIGMIIIIMRSHVLLQRMRDKSDGIQHEKEMVFGFVHDISDIFADMDTIETPALLKRILFYTTRTSQASAGAVYMLNHETRELTAKAIAGLFPPVVPLVGIDLDNLICKADHINDLVKNTPILLGQGLIGQVADIGTTILIEDAELDARIPKYRHDFLKIKSIILVPLRFHQQVLGLVVLVNRIDEQPFTESDAGLLQALADQASVTIHFSSIREQLLEKKRIDHDLDVARSIQFSLLPKQIPEFPGIEIAAYNYPALEVGGDYYDFIQVDEDHLGIAIADVSGKGISGAIIMAMCRSVLRAQARGNRSPADVLRTVNQVMLSDISEDMFVCMLYMVLNIHTHEITVARAGLERPILYTNDAEQSVTPINTRGCALGLTDEDTFDMILEEVTMTMQPGSVIVAYSDGITEARDVNQEEWGFANLTETVRQTAPEDAYCVIGSVRERIMRFVGKMKQYDDMTLLALRII